MNLFTHLDTYTSLASRYLHSDQSTYCHKTKYLTQKRKEIVTLSVSLPPGPPNTVPAPIVPITNNRRFSMVMDWACDCHYCPQSDRTKPDYYPICAEKNGVQTTFDTWCHFDCENRCYEYTSKFFCFQVL